jgi:hypothetical protein
MRCTSLRTMMRAREHARLQEYIGTETGMPASFLVQTTPECLPQTLSDWCILLHIDD